MKSTFIAKTSLKPGQRTSLGEVTNTKVSPSGKTIVITVKRADGTTFTDRLSAIGNIAVFTED
jgi:hypothetical protein